MTRSLHLWRSYLSPVCDETPSRRHKFIVLNRTEHDPPDQVQMNCEHCGTAAFFREEKA